MKKFQNILCYCLTSLLVSLRCVRFISKHPMLLFNVPAFIFCIAEPNISKHPMLLFNIRQSDVWRFGFNISKHPMLLFNSLAMQRLSLLAKISKHPMLLFNHYHIRCCFIIIWFQNILCYCLTRLWIVSVPAVKISKHPMLLFNRFTTTITRLTVCISKHPMLLFNCVNCNAITFFSKFQNILCYCLTNVFKPFSQLKSLYTPILHYLIQNYQPANHLFKCVFI